MFPIDRIRELADRKMIKEVAPHHIGMMGDCHEPAGEGSAPPVLGLRILRFAQDDISVAPAVISQLRADGVDALLLSPG